MLDNDITQQIIGAAIEVHRQLGPGLLEFAYEECLCHELQIRKLNFERQKQYRSSTRTPNWIAAIVSICLLRAGLLSS